MVPPSVSQQTKRENAACFCQKRDWFGPRRRKKEGNLGENPAKRCSIKIYSHVHRHDSKPHKPRWHRASARRAGKTRSCDGHPLSFMMNSRTDRATCAARSPTRVATAARAGHVRFPAAIRAAAAASWNLKRVYLRCPSRLFTV